ncbi:MBL fold metallo-hydrolase [Bernardetia sp.]|uniref:MBL fold metallo-hydrolase n=1 Tax=Bernardetia sp. TaxID=1937974 RepID=UPI0025C481E9|nr:MBL fold metallo-hydrolase [Bernardetia sp.]
MVITKSFKHEEVTGIKFGYQPFGMPTLFTHIYFVDGLLIDTGQSNAKSKILEETAKLNIEQIFITHHHEDHTGNISEIQKQHGCNVYASSLCGEMMKKPPKISLAQQLTWGKRPAYEHLLRKDDTIETPNFSFQIIPIAGHAVDMVALYEPTKKWLFSADLYINSYIDYFLENESIYEQINSIKKILELDFVVMFCGHKPQLTNAKAQLTKKLNFLESLFNDVSLLYEKGNSASEILKRLKLKENWFVRILSNGNLSKINMIKSIIRDIEYLKKKS